MILVRTWFRTKWGAASTVVELLKGISTTLEPARRARIYTDLSGELFTVTWETEWPSLAAYEAAFEEMRQSDEYRELMTEIVDLVETDSREPIPPCLFSYAAPALSGWSRKPWPASPNRCGSAWTTWRS